MQRETATSSLPVKGTIVFFVSALDMGGAERQALQLADHMKRKYGLRVEVWGLHSPGDLCPLCDACGIPWRIVPVHTGKGLRRWLKVLSLARRFRRHGVSVVLPFTSVPNVYASLAWRPGGVKLCVWNQRDEGYDLRRTFRYRRAVRSASLICANSEGGAKALQRTYGLSTSTMRIITNGVRIPRPSIDRSAFRQAHGIALDRPAACMIGNISANKDHQTLIRAWRRVVDTKPATLVLAGRRDDAYPAAQRLVSELELDNHVTFLGFCSDIDSLLSSCELGVFSSRSEGCPNGVLECMAAGLAVVGPELTSLRQLVAEENRFLLAPAGDAEAFADRILTALGEGAVMKRAGERNREKALSRYGIEEACERYMAMIRDALGDG